MLTENNTQSQSNKEAAVRATPKNTLTGGGTDSKQESEALATSGENNKSCDADSKADFETLIKGEYKKEFADKVQEIINKRFKENKIKESEKEADIKPKGAEENIQAPNLTKADEATLAANAAELIAMGYKDFDLEKEMSNPTFKALIEGGVDMLTAYKAVHFDEIMDGSVAYGATLAAKQLADSIRFKVGRPVENGLSQRAGYAPHSGAAGLTPEKRRELAKKALMGDQISF